MREEQPKQTEKTKRFPREPKS